MLSAPMEKSFADMREELDRLGEKGEPAKDSKVYYGMWIKVLENHYMSLFRSDEYRLALSRLLNETAAFRMTGNDVLTELLEFLPIPTNKEMDELYKELYTLKKQTKEAAKKISKMESALARKGYPMNALGMPVNDIMTKWLEGVEKSRGASSSPKMCCSARSIRKLPKHPMMLSTEKTASS